MKGPPPDGTVERLRWLEAQAERAYGDMYEAEAGLALAARYRSQGIPHDDRSSPPGKGQRSAVATADEIKTVFRRRFS